MTITDLEPRAQALVSSGKGLLAADETPGTLTKRFQLLGINSTPESRRDYREMLFATPGVGTFISGAIMQDETIRQRSSSGAPLPELLVQAGVVPGIKVDTGARPLAGSPGEAVTEGLDGLRDRLAEYRTLGAGFAKWRAVIAVSDTLPTTACVCANAHALARYAAICQEQDIVPIVEPEVLMEGSHTLARCEEVTSQVLDAVFDALRQQHVTLEGMLLKPNMVLAGHEHATPASVDEVATATLRCLRRHVPTVVPGIVFLSGGQDHVAATVHLDAINRIDAPKPWKLTFSYGRALQDEALAEWRGDRAQIGAGQRVFYHRAKCECAAALGAYGPAMESEAALA